ncbi:D-amino acid aminotransferase [Rhodoblastus sphagnicola]|uniref:Probable branched-chain-amino-acid aminotransferase n=1 Tax=Rhodoblastus sphagnicola TaxID=333368 RepID=A0A2S6N4V9_9HYPH|nr:D-amino-acid transaminase [Rhodoblastus sphagnicola]MBB4199623.1 D-alanine transaminase [Rhodoblastus sphagnicola]PPQ29638.1 D-amino acid aminotransferase [Rhodoblastus sphagnicola]
MSRIAYVNGRYIRHAEAGVSIDDRAFLFSDGIYEVIEVFQGALIDERGHLDRLARSAGALRLTPPLSEAALKFVMRELVARNRVRHGHVYLQITRGAARREHVFPSAKTPTTLVAFAQAHDPDAGEAKARKGIAVISVPDIRWKRPDIKTVSLLPNVLAKQQAREAGAYEAWLVDADGFVTEGASSNAWIVDKQGALITHPADSAILSGITRARILEIAKAKGLALVERAFTVAQAHDAAEAFISGATTLVMPVVKLDGRPIGAGAPGPVALGLRAAFHEFAVKSG